MQMTQLRFCFLLLLFFLWSETSQTSMLKISFQFQRKANGKGMINTVEVARRSGQCLMLCSFVRRTPDAKPSALHSFTQHWIAIIPAFICTDRSFWSRTDLGHFYRSPNKDVRKAFQRKGDLSSLSWIASHCVQSSLVPFTIRQQM